MNTKELIFRLESLYRLLMGGYPIPHPQIIDIRICNLSSYLRPHPHVENADIMRMRGQKYEHAYHDTIILHFQGYSYSMSTYRHE